MTHVPSAIRSTWLGASRFVRNKDELAKVSITREEYQEHGAGWAAKRFSGVV